MAILSAREPLFLPSSNRDTDNPLQYLQPTDPGKNNGGFGLVRENGHRFHGGIDIRAVLFDGHGGEARDGIFAVADGRVAYINRRPEGSSYGSYVVLEHRRDGFPFLTIYAHLNNIAAPLKIHDSVLAGQQIATIGRTSNSYNIPRDRTHLHFEIGLPLGTAKTFQWWYDRQHFPDPNHHGPHNGLNWVSIDPLPILQAREMNGLSIPRTIGNYPTAFVTRIPAGDLPDFLKRYGPFFLHQLGHGSPMKMEGGQWNDPTIEQFMAPEMLAKKRGCVPGKEVVGRAKSLLIFWTWFGLPKYWIGQVDDCHGLELLHYDPDLLERCIRRGTLKRDNEARVMVGKRTKDTLEKIFGSEF